MSQLESQNPISPPQDPADAPAESSLKETTEPILDDQETEPQHNGQSSSPSPDHVQPGTPAMVVRAASVDPIPISELNNILRQSNNGGLSPLDTTSHSHNRDVRIQNPSPLSAGLRIQTNVTSNPPGYTVTAATDNSSVRTSGEIPLGRSPSVRSVLGASGIGNNLEVGSAASSTISSPMLSAMADVTPLPSPLLSGDSPGPWRLLAARPGSRDSKIHPAPNAALVTANGESISAAIANQTKRRVYQGLSAGNESALQINREKNNGEAHTRHRSLSEYTPEALQSPTKLRQITVSGSHSVSGVHSSREQLATSPERQMRREPHLALQRGLGPGPRPPTPPSSRTGESSDSDSSLTRVTRLHKKPRYEYFEAYSRGDSKLRRWRALKPLGEGTFSRVVLATSQKLEEDRIDENDPFVQQDDEAVKSEEKIDRKKLVAIKICEHGPKGGASEERVEMSLKRELEIMKSIHHPSLVHLKAWNIEETRAILVLSYCPGGDLFEVASEHKHLLVPGLIRRIFAELVGAVRYLHERHIVHRDIKLENVLVNLPYYQLAQQSDWATYPYSITTLTDLGLSRRVADDEKLTTRCGSDDYAAPEVIMGQPYDGRSTDAWSLGVLLYALLENRLPFDAHPGASESHKQRSRTSHRIARVEWCWVEYAGEDGDHEGDEKKFEERGLLGAMSITEGLLKRARTRWTLEKVSQEEWVRGGISVEGGIRFREEDLPDEVTFDVDKPL